MAKKQNNNRIKGFTLIELVVTIAMLGIVILAVLNFFTYNLSTYSRGSEKADVQFDVRMAADLITTELRNVVDISTTDNTLNTVLDLSVISAKYPSVKSVNFEITKEDLNYFVIYTVTGNADSGNSNYEMTSKVLLNNIKTATLATGDTLYYKK